jgi:hypothetical protein
VEEQYHDLDKHTIGHLPKPKIKSFKIKKMKSTLPLGSAVKISLKIGFFGITAAKR